MVQWFEVAKIETKLISVEGMPCSGRSEAASSIAETLSKNGRKCLLFEENDMNNPAQYAFHAFMKEDQIKALSTQEQRQIYNEGTKVSSGLVIPLTKVSVSLFGKVLPNKIYDNLDWETEKPVILEQWQSFAKRGTMRRKVHVFNGSILHTLVSEMLMRFDFTYAAVRDCLFELYRLIAPMHPVIIYLKCTDIKARMEEEAQRRGSAWLDGMIRHHTEQGYGLRNKLKGFDGYVDCLEARQRIEIKLLNDLPYHRLVLTDPFNNWTQAYETISDSLKLNECDDV